ncbi:hypothetical protein DFH94DRAFT_744266, partial [Russula ochroleuca]
GCVPQILPVSACVSFSIPLVSFSFCLLVMPSPKPNHWLHQELLCELTTFDSRPLNIASPVWLNTHVPYLEVVFGKRNLFFGVTTATEVSPVQPWSYKTILFLRKVPEQALTFSKM